ncbi:uncharacterized protein [Choristoneura fumiferana]|uniref:uncharacterized protein n=1 Tax=Choristoneura fumiferana TaxID=7141 RepID=UPI003D15E5B6
MQNKKLIGWGYITALRFKWPQKRMPVESYGTLPPSNFPSRSAPEYAESSYGADSQPPVVEKQQVEEIAVNLFYGLVSSLWVVKNFTLLIVLCVACQKFYLVVEEVEKATAVISGCHASLFILQKLCKNVLRVTSCARAAGGLRAGGVVAVDAGLPLRLLALLATYTVVLLQFAFL